MYVNYLSITELKHHHWIHKLEHFVLQLLLIVFRLDYNINHIYCKIKIYFSILSAIVKYNNKISSADVALVMPWYKINIDYYRKNIDVISVVYHCSDLPWTLSVQVTWVLILNKLLVLGSTLLESKSTQVRLIKRNWTLYLYCSKSRGTNIRQSKVCFDTHPSLPGKRIQDGERFQFNRKRMVPSHWHFKGQIIMISLYLK